MNSILVGKHIRMLRIKAGLTQEHIADQLMVSRQAVSKWENGVAAPDVALLPKLSKILDMDIEGILYGAPHDVSDGIVGVISLWPYANTEIYPTDLVNDKPILVYSMSMLMLCTIRSIVITGPSVMLEVAKKVINEYLKPEYGISVSFSKSLIRYTGKHIVLLDANSYLYGIDLTRFLQRTIVSKEEMSIVACNAENINEKDRIYRNYDNRLIVYDKKSVADRDSSFRAFPFLSIKCINEDTLIRFERVKCNSVKRLIECDLSKNEIHVETIGRGMLSFEIKNSEDLEDFSKTIEYISKTQHYEISDLNEIAKRRYIEN